MPTVILLDISLSMSRPVQTSDTSENHTRYSLAVVAINTFLDYLNIHAKLEYVSLVAFSSMYEVVVPFTRDYDSIRSKLPHVEEGDKTCIEQALLGINQLILNEWGYQTPVQIILVTDGNSGVGTLGRNRIIQALPLPPPFPARIHVLPVASPHDPSLTQAMPLYQKIVDLACITTSSATISTLSRGAVYSPDQLTATGVSTAMNRLCEQQYAEFVCTLRCGQLSSRVQLYPPPSTDETGSRVQLAQQIHVIGFISQQDLGTPITISKHLIIPQAQVVSNGERREAFGSKTPTKDGATPEGSEEDLMDPSKIPNFCVLLHGALKVEGMSAIVQLADNCWGAISAWCEAARTRRSCLLLSALAPGPQSAPWLGPLSQLGPASDVSTEAFPIRASRSYPSGTAAWSRPHALLADMQKVLRHARKLPEKTQHLYKELNRLRRTAISLGFSELLACVGTALEREIASLPLSSPPECALQLAHAAAALREHKTAFDAKHTLQPLTGNFTVPSSH